MEHSTIGWPCRPSQRCDVTPTCRHGSRTGQVDQLGRTPVQMCLLSFLAGRLVPVFTPPTPEQRWALAVAASYLRRAGTEAATRLHPDARALHDENALFGELRESM